MLGILSDFDGGIFLRILFDYLGGFLVGRSLSVEERIDRAHCDSTASVEFDDVKPFGLDKAINR